MKTIFLAMAFFFSAQVLHAEEFLKPQTTVTLKKPYWAMALVQLDSTSPKKLALLSSSAVELGQLQDNTFKIEQHFLLTDREPLRIFSFDCNQDGREEIIVSAITRGVANSLILTEVNGELKALHNSVPWHLAVKEKSAEKILVGQKSRETKLFAGKVQQLSCTEKISTLGKIPAPRAVNLFEFSFVQAETPQIVESHDLEPLTLWEQDGKKFQRLWQSASRHGSRSTHVLAREDNTVLVSSQENFVVPHEPLSFAKAGKNWVAASRHDWAFGGVVGRVPLLKSVQLVFYAEEPELGFDEANVSKTIAGSVLDYILDKRGENEALLHALIAPKGQENRRLLLSYELK